MMLKANFKDSINMMTLRFKNEELEERYLDWKEEQMLDFTVPKRILIATAFAMNIMLLYACYTQYKNEEYTILRALLICIAVADIGVAIEWTIHFFPSIKVLRSIPISCACYFASAYYSSIYLNMPGITPGYFFGN